MTIIEGMTQDLRTSRYAPKYHNHGVVTYWSVYEQRWIKSGYVPNRELAAMSEQDRIHVIEHMCRGDLAGV